MLGSAVRSLPRLVCPCRFSSGGPGSAALGSQENPFDVIIAGGGMVGTALACGIASRPELASQRVLLLEAGRDMPQLPAADSALPKVSNRVSALTPGSVSLLNDLGAWQHVEKIRSQSFSKMHVWERVPNAMISFDASTIDPISIPGFHLHSSPIMGVVAENWLVHAALQQSLAERNSGPVSVRTNARVTDAKIPMAEKTPVSSEAECPSPWATVTLDDDSTLHSRLLVGADGPSSLIRRCAGIETVSHNYQQSAVVATLDWEQNDQDSAYQRFLPDGPIALLPLSESKTSLVWTTTPEHAKALCQMEAEKFILSINSAYDMAYTSNPIVEACNDAMKQFLAQCTESLVGRQSGPAESVSCPRVTGLDEGSRGFFPLALCHAKDYVGQRLALIGDAAHRVHPLAGQGVNLGYGDVRQLLDAMVTALSEGQDVGSLHHLEDYESKRLWQVLPTMASIHSLKHLYGTSSMPVELLRSIGVQLTNASTPVKTELMQRAMR